MTPLGMEEEISVRADFKMTPPATLAPDADLRSALLQYFVEYATATELADWLRNIGQDAKGTVEERRSRVLAKSKYPAMPAAEFPAQTLYYLETYSSAEHLEGICETLGIDPDGSRERCWRRVMREVGIREGWLPKLRPITPESVTVQNVRPFVEWHLLAKLPKYEKDFYLGFYEDMVDVFGEAQVHEQLPVASGSVLKIDFHIGHPQHGGVGIEVKLPANNSDLQRALGQMDQYQARYRDQLIVLLLPYMLNTAQTTLFTEQLVAKGVAVVVK